MELVNALKSCLTSLTTLANGVGKFSIVSDYAGDFKGRGLISQLYCKEDSIDMGLPSGTRWGSKNLGAARETDWGMYFSWGNIDAHQEGAGYNFSQDVYNATNGNKLTTDITINYDAAHALLGGSWKMPTTTQYAELFNSAYTDYVDADGNVVTGTDKRVTYKGVKGLLLRSKSNGNLLFFPCAGYYDGTSLGNRGSYGLYWSSSWISATHARCLGFNSGGVNPQNDYSRRLGFSVRPVQ